MQNYVYNTNFTGNVFIVGKTGCGKTVNNFFCKLKWVKWVSYVNLYEKREAEMILFFLRC